MYQAAIRPLLFSGLRADPEWLHQQTLAYLAKLDPTYPPRTGIPSAAGQWLRHQMEQHCCQLDDRLHQSLWGLTFHNPMGLAAGFDKDAVAAGLWPSLGFGLAELGTVTHHPQPGNPQPRLFRLVQDQAALNRMGFNNAGAATMAARLEAAWAVQPPQIPMGINLGKSKVTPLEAAAEDYVSSFRQLRAYGDYFVVNVSSPNTPGLRSLQSADQLAQILTALQEENQGQKPLLVKIAPDLEWEAISDVIHLAQTHNLAGIIATNTTIRRDNLKTQVIAATGQPVREEAGGISGAPVRQRSTEVIRFIYEQTQGQLTIIGVGGIFTAADSWEKITAGASLLQVYTGWIYEGPLMVKRILQGLGEQLDRHGFANLTEAVGSESYRPMP